MCSTCGSFMMANRTATGENPVGAIVAVPVGHPTYPFGTSKVGWLHGEIGKARVKALRPKRAGGSSASQQRNT